MSTMFKILNWLLFDIVPKFSIFAGLAMMEEKKGIVGALEEQEKGYDASTADLERRKGIAEEDVATTEAAGLETYQGWQEAGDRARDSYEGLISGGLSQEELEQDPSYRFRMQQGLQARERTASRMGNRFSGGLMMGLEQYAQGMASQEYGNIYGRKSQGYGNLMNMGWQADQASNQWRGQMYGARRGLDQYYGGQLNQNIMGRAGARAAATYGQAQAGAKMYAGIHKDMAKMGMSAAGYKGEGGGETGLGQGGYATGTGPQTSGSYDSGGNWGGGSSQYDTSGMFNNMSWQ